MSAYACDIVRCRACPRTCTSYMCLHARTCAYTYAVRPDPRAGVCPHVCLRAYAISPAGRHPSTAISMKYPCKIYLNIYLNICCNICCNIHAISMQHVCNIYYISCRSTSIYCNIYEISTSASTAISTLTGTGAISNATSTAGRHPLLPPPAIRRRAGQHCVFMCVCVCVCVCVCMCLCVRERERERRKIKRQRVRVRERERERDRVIDR
jgi:hypothetical protein